MVAPAPLTYGLPSVASFQEQVPLASSQGEKGPSVASWEGLPYGVLAPYQGRLKGGEIITPAGGTAENGVGVIFPY